MTLEEPTSRTSTDPLDLFTKVYETIRSAEPAVIAIVIRHSGSSPGKTGFKALIYEDRILGTVGGGSVEAEVVKKARALLKEPVPAPYTIDFALDHAAEEPGPTCGGSVSVYLEPIGLAPRVFIFGAGHVCYELAPLLHKAGFRVVIVDDRQEFANKQRFPMAEDIITLPMDSALNRLTSRISERDYIIIVTRGHKHDETVLNWAVTTTARYIGMIGSSRKISLAIDTLRSKGVTESQIQRITAPIGLPIGSQTPFEIAISITAQLIAVKRNRYTHKKEMAKETVA
ncbi:MAG: XdhC family protein [Candidatus Ranarchaeia archaeon]